MPPPGWDELLPKEEQSLLWRDGDSKEEEVWHQQIVEEDPQQQQQDIIWQQPESTSWPDEEEGDGWQGGYGPLTVQVAFTPTINIIIKRIMVLTDCKGWNGCWGLGRDGGSHTTVLGGQTLHYHIESPLIFVQLILHLNVSFHTQNLPSPIAPSKQNMANII